MNRFLPGHTRIECARCGVGAWKPTGGVNRSRAKGAPIYCGKACFGLASRNPNPPSETESKTAKAEYDRQRRAAIGDRIRAEKRAAYHAAVAADPEAMRVREREMRKRRMPKHVEYCRRPEYRAKKHEYDVRRGAQQRYGPFADAFLVLRDLETEIASRATRTEIYAENGTLNKSIKRKREYGKAVGS